MPKATQLQMDYQKPKSRGLTSGPGRAPQTHQPQALVGTKLPAGCPAGRSGGALGRKPASSAESLWALAGVGRRKVAARAVVTAWPFAPQGSQQPGFTWPCQLRTSQPTDPCRAWRGPNPHLSLRVYWAGAAPCPSACSQVGPCRQVARHRAALPQCCEGAVQDRRALREATVEL